MLPLLVTLAICAPTETDLALDALTSCPAVEDEACIVAAARLKLAGEPAHAPLAKRVEQMSAAGQVLAVNVVGDVHTPTVHALLTKLAGNKRGHAVVRVLAIDALGKRRDPAGLKLATRLMTDGDALVRQAAVRVLANNVTANDKVMIAALVRASQDAAPAVRADAAFGLGFCGCSQAGPVLAKRLGDDDVVVRRAAAEGLCFVKHGAAVPALITALRAGDELLVRAAARALHFQTDQSFGDDAAAWDEWRQKNP